jgi:hypothetical protein
MQFVRCANNTLLSLAYNRFADKMLDVFGELMKAYRVRQWRCPFVSGPWTLVSGPLELFTTDPSPSFFLAIRCRSKIFIYTPSGLLNEVVLDMI